MKISFSCSLQVSSTLPFLLIEMLDMHSKETMKRTLKEVGHVHNIMSVGYVSSFSIVSHVQSYCHGDFGVFLSKLVKNFTWDLFSNMKLFVEHWEKNIN